MAAPCDTGICDKEKCTQSETCHMLDIDIRETAAKTVQYIKETAQ